MLTFTLAVPPARPRAAPREPDPLGQGYRLFCPVDTGQLPGMSEHMCEGTSRAEKGFQDKVPATLALVHISRVVEGTDLK